jgi:hypothetical protein
MTDKKQMSAAEAMARTDIPASALRAMEQIPYDARADLKAYGFASGGPTSAIPADHNSQATPPNPPGSGTGWQSQRELGPQPGIDLIDRMCINADQRERAQAQQPDYQRMIEAMMKTQTMILELLARFIVKDAQAKEPENKK